MGRHSSPADRACSLLAFWHDPADESVFAGWLKKPEVTSSIRWTRSSLAKRSKRSANNGRDHHFDNEKPEDRTFNTFNEPLHDPTGNHALVQFWVEYKHWGYSQVLVLTKQQGEWQLRFVAQDQHWQTQPTPDDR